MKAAKERILAIRLSEKVARNPEYAKRIDVSVATRKKEEGDSNVAENKK